MAIEIKEYMGGGNMKTINDDYMLPKSKRKKLQVVPNKKKTASAKKSK